MGQPGTLAIDMTTSQVLMLVTLNQGAVLLWKDTSM
jgi:hypothetical protein